MKTFIKTVLRPIDNRYHTGKKLARLQYLIVTIPVVIICLLGMVFGDTGFFAVLIAAILALTLLDYFVFDAISDKLYWLLLWKRFYNNDPPPLSEEENVMKQFDRNPTQNNFESLQKSIRRKNNE